MSGRGRERDIDEEEILGGVFGTKEVDMDGSYDGIADGFVVGTKEGVIDVGSDGVADGNTVGNAEGVING